MELRFRSERRLGEMIKAQAESVGLNKGAAEKGRTKQRGSDEEPRSNAVPTLAEAGIDKKLSSRSQKLASIPEQKFDDKLSNWRETSLVCLVFFQGDRELRAAVDVDCGRCVVLLAQLA